MSQTHFLEGHRRHAPLRTASLYQGRRRSCDWPQGSCEVCQGGDRPVSLRGNSCSLFTRWDHSHHLSQSKIQGAPCQPGPRTASGTIRSMRNTITEQAASDLRADRRTSGIVRSSNWPLWCRNDAPIEIQSIAVGQYLDHR